MSDVLQDDDGQHPELAATLARFEASTDWALMLRQDYANMGSSTTYGLIEGDPVEITYLSAAQDALRVVTGVGLSDGLLNVQSDTQRELGLRGRRILPSCFVYSELVDDEVIAPGLIAPGAPAGVIALYLGQVSIERLKQNGPNGCDWRIFSYAVNDAQIF